MHNDITMHTSCQALFFAISGVRQVIHRQNLAPVLVTARGPAATPYLSRYTRGLAPSSYFLHLAVRFPDCGLYLCRFVAGYNFLNWCAVSVQPHLAHGTPLATARS